MSAPSKKGKGGGSKKQDKEATKETGNVENEGESSEGRAFPDLYEKFVTSFQNALSSVTDDEGVCKQKLSSLTIEGIAEFIREKKAKNIIVMAGAGISTSAGIPDFRSPGTGLYDNLAEYDLPDPMAIFEINFFKKKPEPFYTLARQLFPKTLKPTPCHYFIRLLSEKGLLLRCFTQNIDALEFLAGLDADKVVTAHGSHQTSRCLRCSTKYDMKWLSEKLSDETCKVVRCDECNGLVKPDIVFFGESLPERFFRCAVSDFPKCDLLIIMGTSLVVNPFAGLVQEVKDDVPRLLINFTEAGRVKKFGEFGLCYGFSRNYRDVFWKGSCDDGAYLLAELLGWKDELKAMVDKEWATIDSNNAKKAEALEKTPPGKTD